LNPVKHLIPNSILFTLFMLFFIISGASLLYAFVVSPTYQYFLFSEVLFVLGLLFYLRFKRQKYENLIDQLSVKSEEITKTKIMLHKVNDHAIALQKLASELVICNSQDEVCEAVTNALVDDFGYDSGQFWLKSKAAGRLTCLSASGETNERIFEMLNKNAGENAESMLQMAITRNQTVIVNDLNSYTGNDLNATKSYRELLNLSSFVITPLVNNEQEPIGLITVGYHRGQGMNAEDANILERVTFTASDVFAKDDLKRLEEKDKLLVNSISHLVGDTLERLELFSDMERKIEVRTDELKQTLSDLTKAREMVIQSEKLSSLGKMAAGIIHEINDPLNFMVNILPDVKKDVKALTEVKELAEQSLKGTEAGMEIKRIADEADLESHLEDMDFIFSRSMTALGKSARLAKNMTVFTKPSAHGEVKNINVLDIARETVKIIPQKIIGNAQVVVSGEEKLMWNVNADRLEQVYINLINNALDAMDRKGHIEISGENNAQGIIVHVANDGPVIPDDIQKKIFDPFFTTKPAGKSTGLGLSICAEIVREFGGRIELFSEQGKGTRFDLIFTKEQLEAVKKGLPELKFRRFSVSAR